MISAENLKILLNAVEADNVERTISTNDADKHGEAICAFANDLPDRREAGVLFVGAKDDGSCGGLNVGDDLLQQLLGFGRDGRIVPLPSVIARKVKIDGCELAVVEVLPSDNPPVRYKGRVCVRRGPQRGFANPDEERRLTEKRRWGNLSFDQHGVKGAKLEDIDLPRFKSEYLPSLVSRDVILENDRDQRDQLLALRLIAQNGEPTTTALLFLGIEARRWVPGAYLQFVRYDGTDPTAPVKDQKEISGPLTDQFRRINEVFEANISTATNLAGEKEVRNPDYPLIALQELVRNAMIHRNYETSNSPTRVNWYIDRIEILSPGGPFGQVTQANFGSVNVTDYRNPAIAEAAKALGFTQSFGSGIPRARAALQANGSPALEFQVNQNYVMAQIKRRQ